MIKPSNCQVEPPYPIDAVLNHVVTFSLRAPDYVSHRKHVDCMEEYPHPISECGMFEAIVTDGE